MSQIKVPTFFNDLYRDLRDRRLLLPAVALAAALVAVPVLLAKGSPPATPPLAPPAVETTATQPAVLAEQAGIRNYSERLEALKSKNPFKQQFKLPTPESVAIAGADSATTAATDSAVGVADTSSAAAVGVEDASSAVATTPADTGSAEPTSSGTKTKTTTKTIARRVDVAIGPLGEAEKVTNVRDLDFLPSTDQPLVAFLGVSEDGRRAAFLVSNDVVSTDGDGSCVPDPCQFLTLKKGQQRFLHYQPEDGSEAIVYRLKLLRIRDAVLKRN